MEVTGKYSVWVAGHMWTDATISRMADDAEETANIAQARLLLGALWEQVEETSVKIEDEEARVAGKPAGSPARPRRVSTAQLRKELYQLHGMIDGINRRFPQIATGV